MLSRTKSRLGAAPRTPALLGGAVADGHSGELRLTGDAATFELHADVEPGWLAVRIGLGPIPGTTGKVRLLVTGSDGSTIAAGLELDEAGSGQTVIRVPQRMVGLRLEVANVTRFQAPVVDVRPITAMQATAALAWPVLLRRLREPWDVPKAAVKLVKALRSGGGRAVTDHLLRKEKGRTGRLGYAEWYASFARLSDGDRSAIRQRSEALATRFSVVMPVHETPGPWLVRAIDSVKSQLYPRWELCIADDASRSPEVRRILQDAARGDNRIKVAFLETASHIAAASNAALRLSTGDFVVLLDHDDELTEHALYMLATAAADADVVYSDEDKIDESGALYDPFFKPDWNPDLLLSNNYVGHLCAIRRSLIEQLGGFREGFEGSQDYDLMLRASARTSRIAHVPHVLYHWRSIAGSTARAASAKSYAEDAAIKALQQHVGADAVVAKGDYPTTYRTRWRTPAPPPLVSLIIPTRNGRRILETCVESIVRMTAYQPFELVIVDNQSTEREALDYFSVLEQRGVARVVRFDAPFNYAAINNFAARHCRGSVLGLLNNDLEVLERGWLEEMVSQAMRPGIGAVGARLLYPNRTLQHGGIVLGVGGVAGHAHKYAPVEAPGYFWRAQLVHDVSAVTGACLLIRKDTFERVGGLDEQFAVALNDVDFCLRVRALGLRNLWTPFATLIHHESLSRGRDDDTRAKRARFQDERRRMAERWGDLLRNDPAYNPNLTLDAEDFALAWPPRARKPWC